MPPPDYSVNSYSLNPLVVDYFRACEAGKIPEWKRALHIPDDLEVALADTDEEVIGDISKKKDWVAIRGGPLLVGGLSLPLPEIIGQFLSWQKVPPISLSLNAYRILLGAKRLSDELGVGLELKDIMGCYQYNYHVKQPTLNTRSHLYLVIGIPGSYKGYVSDTFFFKGPWQTPGAAFTLRRGHPSTWIHPTELGRPDPTKILKILNYFGPDGKDPEARHAHKVLGYTPTSGATLQRTRSSSGLWIII